MRDPDRISDVLDRLKEIWLKYPDLRLGQLIGNVLQDPVLYYIEDKELVDRLDNYYTNTEYIDNDKV